MELKRYWDIVWRRLPVVLAVPFLVGIGSLALFLIRPASYTAQAKLQLVLVSPQANSGDGDFFRYDKYYNYLATEYAADDLAELGNSNRFADAVARTLQGPDFNLPIDAKELQGTMKARRAHRVLLLDATTSDPDRSMAVAGAASRTLQHDPLGYFSAGGAGPKQEAALIVINQPLEARSNRVAGLFNVALQTTLGLFAGLGLAFLLEYLDDRLRGADAVGEALGLPVLAQIPANGHDRRGQRFARAGG